MSKPKPGLGKGLVRTLAQQHQHQHQHQIATSSHAHAHVHSHSTSQSHVAAVQVHGHGLGQHSTSAAPLSLAPVVGHHGGPCVSKRGGQAGASAGPGIASGSGGNHVSVTPGWPLASSSTSASGHPVSATASSNPNTYLALLPSWDNPLSLPLALPDAVARLSLPDVSSIVMHYRPIPSRSNSRINPLRLSVPAPVRLRRYTTASLPARDAFAFPSPHSSTVPVPPSLLLDLGAPLWPGHGKDLYGSPLSHEFFSPPPPPPSEGATRGSPPPIKQPRPSESHTVLSPTPLQASENPNAVSLFSYPYLAFPDLPDPTVLPTPPASADEALANAYASNLVFRYGATGLPKERPAATIPTQGRERSTTPPPRQRSFPLPKVSAPSELRSVGVGEDAYFARPDGMCVADGVGGWARSGRGGADAGRWSRLLTHFCETEVTAWWAGKEEYLEQIPGGVTGAEETLRMQAASADEGVHGWAGKLWKGREARGNGHGLGLGLSDEDASGVREGWRRRTLDPVEIMQRGFEKCLACVLAEGIHGSSTCLLALLHHSSLLIANLGDCCLLVIRSGEVVFRTSEMQHAFNFPLQLGTHSRDEPMKDAQRFQVEVEREDVVVVGSDGLMDNLFDEDILDVLAEFAPPAFDALPTPPPSRPASTSGLTPFNPQKVSEALCRKAREVSEQTSATTPFMVRAIEEGIDFVGGKKDDISVLVGVIGERKTEEGRQGLALHTH